LTDLPHVVSNAPALQLSNTAAPQSTANNIFSDINNFVNGAANTFLNGVGKATQASSALNNLQATLSAPGIPTINSPALVPGVTQSSIPIVPIMVIGGFGLLAVMLVSRSGARGRK
jgi:hypothetical protein